MITMENRSDTADVEKGSSLHILDRNHMLSILVYLRNNRPAIKSEILNNVSHSRTVMDKLEALRAMGLIEVYSIQDSRLSFIVLTDKGERVARMIDDLIDEIDR